MAKVQDNVNNYYFKNKADFEAHKAEILNNSTIFIEETGENIIEINGTETATTEDLNNIVAGNTTYLVPSNTEVNAMKATINNSLQKPTTAPTATELVGVDTNKAQVNIGIGSGLSLENGTLKATGGGGGTTQNLYMHNFNLSSDIENIDIYFQLLSTVEAYDLTNPENIFVNTLSDVGIVLATGSVDYSNNQRLIITGISIRTSQIVVCGVNINNGYIINNYELTSTINDVDITDAVIPVE